MEDDFDIYEGLCLEKNHEENCQPHQNNKELLDKVEKLEEKIKNLETDLMKEANQRTVLETNFSSLLKTAKNELSRKDRIISDLRAQIDNFYFRRNNVKPKKDDSTKNNPKAQKDPEPTPKCQVEEKQEKPNDSDKSLPLYLSPGPQMISRLESLSDEEKETEIICQRNQLTSTVFGERLKKKLKDQEAKEKLQKEQAKSLISIPKKNDIENKTELETTSNNSMDNKENQYRLISLDLDTSPKKNMKRENDNKINEVLDKRKKYTEYSEASQSCKSDKKDSIENSGNCTDKFNNKNVHSSEYFCQVDRDSNPSINIDRHEKKPPMSPEHDKIVHSSRNINDKRDDRYYKKYRDNDHRDDRSKSRNRRSTDSEKNYSCIDRGRSNDRGRYHGDRGRNNYYNRENEFSNNQTKNRIDLRNHIKPWKKNEIAYEHDANERSHSNENFSKVRRSQRLEAKSHSHHIGYKDDNYPNKDNYKNRQYEEKNRTRRRSRSRERSRPKHSADSISPSKDDNGQINNEKGDQIKSNYDLEDGEILDALVTDEVVNIFGENNGNVQSNVLNPVFQSPREEKIEHIQEFIQNFDDKKKTVQVDNKNCEKHTDSSTDVALKNDKKDNSQHKCDKSIEKKTDSVQKNNSDRQLDNTDTKSIKEVNQKENKTNQEIVSIKTEQPPESKLELPSNVTTKPTNNKTKQKENKSDTNKTEVISNNEDQNNLNITPEITTTSTTSEESSVKQKPKIIRIDDLTATRDPDYCKLLYKYLTKKPEPRSSKSNETSTSQIGNDDIKKIQIKHDENIKVVPSEPEVNIQSEECKKEEPLEVESDKSTKINTSLEKSEESSSSSTSSALKTVCKKESTADLVDDKIKNNDCSVSPIPKNPMKRTASEDKINVKRPNTSAPEAKQGVALRKRKEKVDENQNLNKNDGVIFAIKRRPIRLSDFSSPVTVVATVEKVDNDQTSTAKLETVKE